MGFFRRKEIVPLAIELGTDSIKVMKISETLPPKILKVGMVSTPYGTIKDGFITDPRGVGNVLSKLLHENQIRDKICVTAISGQQVIMRIIKLPPMSEEEVRQAISYQAEKYIPFPIDQVIVDVHILGETLEQDGKRISVLLVAAQKEPINSIIETLKCANLKPLAIEVEPFAIVTSICESSLFKTPEIFEDTILVLEVSASSTKISVLSNGILRFTRVIPIGGIQFTRAISSALNLNFEDAEKMKKEEGAAFLDGDTEKDFVATKQIVNILSPILASLSIEIQRSLAYYESKFRRARISKILLTGGSSLLRNFDKFITSEIGIEVVRVSPVENLEFEEKNIQAEFLKEISPFLSVVTGLSFREIEEERAEKFLKFVTLDNNFEFGSSRQVTGFTG
jgi:type IV pilus assembly protein PilM